MTCRRNLALLVFWLAYGSIWAISPTSPQLEQVMTQAADGNLVHNQTAWEWVPHGATPTKTLPAPRGDFQVVALPFAKGPMAMSARHLVWWHKDGWVTVSALSRLERMAYKDRLGSFHGAKIIFPHVVTVGNRIWQYQAGDGTLAIFDRDGQKRYQGKIEDDRQPVVVADTLLWLNAPDEGDISRNTATDQFSLAQTERIRDLSKYSPVFAAKDGLWILTFPMGFTDSLDAWDQGAIEVHANFVSLDDKEIKLARWSLGELPLRFFLGVRASGSPKLEVEADFTGQMVRTGDGQFTQDLAIILAKHALVVSADRGLVRKLPARPQQGAEIWLGDEGYHWQNQGFTVRPK